MAESLVLTVFLDLPNGLAFAKIPPLFVEIEVKKTKIFCHILYCKKIRFTSRGSPFYQKRTPMTQCLITKKQFQGQRITSGIFLCENVTPSHNFIIGFSPNSMLKFAGKFFSVPPLEFVTTMLL